MVMPLLKPKAFETPARRMPPLTEMLPVKSLVLPKVRMPAPFLVMLALPFNLPRPEKP